MPPITLREYLDPEGRSPFGEWLEGLRDTAGRARILRRLTRLRAGLWGDAQSVGGAVLELREHAGPGYRVYCAPWRCAGDPARRR